MTPPTSEFDAAIALLRVLVAYSHEPLPSDLLKSAADFLKNYPLAGNDGKYD